MSDQPFTDDVLMTLALEEAQAAFMDDEVPVGAIIVREGRIIAKAHNQTRGKANPLQHAELCAIEQASAALYNERLTGCELFVTKEPCSMCAGAIVNARISRIIIAARDIRYGACGTVLSVCGNTLLNHVPVIEFGLKEQESAELLKKFFKLKRDHH